VADHAVDADSREKQRRLNVERDLPADDVRVAAEVFEPDAMTEHQHPLVPTFGVVRQHIPPDHRRDRVGIETSPPRPGDAASIATSREARGNANGSSDRVGDPKDRRIHTAQQQKPPRPARRGRG
jgi:hypothetical protein